MFAEVIVDVAHSETDRVFDYAFSDENVKVGCRVEVPFGRQNKEGFVIAPFAPSSECPVIVLHWRNI